MSRRRREPPAAAGPPDTSRAQPPAAPPRDPAPAGAIEGLTAREELVALAVATGKTLADAARDSGAGRRTVYDIVRRPAVAERIRAIRLEILQEGVGKLTALHSEAIDTVAAIMRDQAATPHTRVWAAQLIMEKTIVLTEHMEVRRELAEMRQQLAESHPRR